MPLFDGFARKVSILIVTISFLGWCAYVVGFALLYSMFVQRSGYNLDSCGSLCSQVTEFTEVIFLPFWCFIGTGLVMYILTLLHLAIGHAVLGLFVNLFTLLFVAFGGGMLYLAGIVFEAITYENITVDLIQTDFGKYAVTAFAGCLTSMVFVGISMLLWPFFVITQLPSCTSPQRDGFVPLQQEPQLMMNTVAPAAVQPRFPQPTPMVPVASGVPMATAVVKKPMGYTYPVSQAY